MIITSISAKSILDSRKKPTIQISVNGQIAAAPSGKSTGKYENPCYRKSLAQSIKDIHVLSKKLFGLEINSFQDLSKIESLVKKTFKLKNPQDLGANALFALEAATLKALAFYKGIPLWKAINPKLKNPKFPVPVGNAIGGGLHSEQYKNAPTFQEFEIIPQGKSLEQNIKIMNQAYAKLQKSLKTKRVNDEGALQCSLNNEQVLELLTKQKNVRIGLDIAANSFYNDSQYNYKNKSLDCFTQITYINSLIKKYNLLYIEDPIHEQDFSSFAKIKRSKDHLVVGDDLTVTNPNRLKKALKVKAINAMIIKPNQNGSLLELAEVVKLCKKNKIKTILSHRSGETLDTTISDLAVAFQTPYIKTGIKTKWREVKLSRLLELQKESPHSQKSLELKDKILDYWFSRTMKQQFQKNKTMDLYIKKTFEKNLKEIMQGHHDSLKNSPEGTLALIVILDQFSRNIYRDAPKSFAQDKKALALAKHALKKGFDKQIPKSRRMFVYMPFMHSENLKDQNLCVKLFKQSGYPEKYAIAHRDIIKKFKRFPHRNQILKRRSTSKEIAFLKTPGSSF